MGGAVGRRSRCGCRWRAARSPADALAAMRAETVRNWPHGEHIADIERGLEAVRRGGRARFRSRRYDRCDLAITENGNPMKLPPSSSERFLFLFVIALAAPSGSLLDAPRHRRRPDGERLRGRPSVGRALNPAVTLGFSSRGRSPPPRCLGYWAAQVGGGRRRVRPGLRHLRQAGRHRARRRPIVLTALPVETVFTFMLALVVLNAAATRKTEGNASTAWRSASPSSSRRIAGGPISGGAYNPAVGIGATLVAAMHGGSPAPSGFPSSALWSAGRSLVLLGVPGEGRRPARRPSRPRPGSTSPRRT